MRKTALILIPAFLLAAAASAGRADDLPPRITVTGTGEVSAAPDIALVSIGVTQEAEESRAALDAMNAATAAVLERMAAEGIAAADMQTGALQLYPLYNNSSLSSGNRIDGYRASTTIRVRVRDLATLGPVLDTVVSDGANTLSSLEFDIDDPDPLLDEARRAAVADARAAAELLAEAAGVDLGDVIELTDQSGGYSPGPVMMMEARSGGSVPVAEGEVTITANVTMVYRIGSDD